VLGFYADIASAAGTYLAVFVVVGRHNNGCSDDGEHYTVYMMCSCGWLCCLELDVTRTEISVLKYYV